MSWIKSRRIDLWPYTRGVSIPTPVNYGTNVFVTQQFPVGMRTLPPFLQHTAPPFTIRTPVNYGTNISIRQEYPLARMTMPARMDFYPPANNPAKVLFGNRITTQQQFPMDQYVRPQMLLETLYGPPPFSGSIFVKQEYPLGAMTQKAMVAQQAIDVAGTWTAVYTPSIVSPGNNAGNNGFTEVTVIPLAALSATGGSKIRLTVKGVAAGEATILSAMWLGNGGGGDSYDFTGDQVQVKLATSTTITIPVNTEVLLDEVAFVKDGANPLVIAYQFTDSANDDLFDYTRVDSTGYFIKSATEASLQDKTGYTDLSTFASTLLTKIELFI